MRLLLAALFIGNAMAAEKPAIKICLRSSANDPWVVMQAKDIASDLFSRIGVRLEWFYDRRHCEKPPDDYLVVHLTTSENPARPKGALAYSMLSDGVNIEVFYDRVVESIEPHRVHKLLGHILAHEIAHMIQGVNRHSVSGVMKAHWDNGDFQDMSVHPIPFTGEDIELIRRGIAARDLRLMSRRR